MYSPVSILTSTKAASLIEFKTLKCVIASRHCFCFVWISYSLKSGFRTDRYFVVGPIFPWPEIAIIHVFIIKCHLEQ